MNTRKIIHQLDESQYDEAFEEFTLGKGLVPNRYIPEYKEHALKLLDSENPDGLCGYEVDRRPGHRTATLANKDEIVKPSMETAHTPSKRKKTGHEPSRLESFMTNREKNLVSIELGEASEEKSSKFEVTFFFSDGNKECKTFDEDEVKEIKAKYSAFIKESEKTDKDSQDFFLERIKNLPKSSLEQQSETSSLASYAYSHDRFWGSGENRVLLEGGSSSNQLNLKLTR